MELSGFGDIEGVELLQKLPIFSSLTFDETTRLTAIVQHLDVAAGTVLIEEHALGDALFVLKEGEVTVARDNNHDGKYDENEVVGRLKSGDLFGEMSLVDDVLTSAACIASQPSKVLKLPRREFQKLLESDQALALKIYRAFCRTLTDRLRKTNQLLAAQAAHAVAVR